MQTTFGKSPKKRKTLQRAGTADANNHSDASVTHEFTVEVDLDTVANDDFNMDVVLDTEPESSQTEDSDWDPEIGRPDLLLKQVSKATMITVYTGFPDAETFSYLFDYLKAKAKNMNYWKGQSQVLKEKPNERTTQRLTEVFERHEEAGMEPPSVKRGPSRKLSLEQEFLITLMKLRLGLLEDDLAFRFKVSQSLVSAILSTWLRFLAKELSWMIIWPSKGQVKLHLPDSFKRLYPNVRCIIDCSEVFTETPSALDIQAALWSDYKHHCTVKFLVAITPNGAPCYVSQCYGGRATDKYIVRDCDFLNCVEPYDQIMADRGFKIREELLLRNASLCIPPSTKAGMQMVAGDVRETSRIANVRIYVEQAIGRLKQFHILKNILPINYLPLCDDIVQVVCVLTCFQDPLCV